MPRRPTQDVSMAHPSADERQDVAPRAGPGLQRSWRPGLYFGACTVVLGVVVVLNPTTSLNVISVLLGVLLLVAGALNLVRALGDEVAHRGWTALAGLAFVVLGVVLIRHVDVTVVLIALFVGLAWIVQGVVDLMAAADTSGRFRTWLAVSGTVSLAAGIVVVAVPIGSITVLAVLLGIWWIALGVLQIIGALVLRRIIREEPALAEDATNGWAHLGGWPRRTTRAQKSSTGKSKSRL